VTIQTPFGGGDTDLWVYDVTNTAIVGAGNDDTPAAPGPSGSHSTLTRSYPSGSYTVAVSNYNVANNLGSPADDGWRAGGVLDFPGVVANSSTTAAATLNPTIGGTLVTAAKSGAFDIQFVTFGCVVPVDLMELSVD